MSGETHLFYFRCSLCHTVASSPIRATRYECVGCGRWMRFLYYVPVETDEQRALAARGLVFNPHKVEPLPWNCVRCGNEFRVMPFFRPDGRCCRACVKAETAPPLLTPEQVAAKDAAEDARHRSYEERMEAAYRALEGQ